MDKILTYDVVVVGGGPSGVAAALGAKEAGAKTLLIERNPYLGGEATHSGVGAFCGFYSCDDKRMKVVAGAGEQVIKALRDTGGKVDFIISALGNKNINFQPEYLKCALDNLMEEKEIDCFLHTRVVAANTKNGQIQSILCADDEGNFEVMAKTFVDASGDANLAHLAGAKTIWGDEEGNVQAATLPFRLTGVDTAKPMTPAAVEKAIKQAKKDGISHLTKEKGFILKIEGSDTVTVLLPSAILADLSAKEMSAAERNLRRQVLSYVKALKKYMPGMEQAELAMIGPSIGFRETRKMVGKETILAEDVLKRKKREDGIGRGGWKPEIHKSLNEMAVYIEVEDGSYFDIPLGALQSINIDNLYGAGRIVSSDEIAFAAIRVMGTCFATGHGAGVAAAYQAKHNRVSVEDIRRELERQHALI